MARLAILGAGVMGTALCVPAAANGHEVTLIGTPLDDDIVSAIARDGRHPRLDAAVPASTRVVRSSDLAGAGGRPNPLAEADALIIAVSSPGIEWAVGQLLSAGTRLGTVGLVTKGLVETASGPPATYADVVPQRLAEADVAHRGFVGIGGPCIAREIACRAPTSTIYASADRIVATTLGEWLDTDVYRVHLDDDVIGLEACAALKNFFAIAVSSTIGAHAMEKAGARSPARNPTAALFTQATDELVKLAVWIGGRAATARGLAGAGDLHVTVGGGRNSRLGILLGEGMRIGAALAGPLAGETVEGRDTGLVLGPALRRAQAKGALPPLPVTDALLDAIEHDAPFDFDYRLLGHFPTRDKKNQA